MNRLLKMSAAALSTLFIATGANALVNANEGCPEAKSDCSATNPCASAQGNCSSTDSVDLQSIVDQCGSNTELLKALIESGNCNANDLKCLISDGACTSDEVCSALEGCENSGIDVKSVLKSAGCNADSDCVSSSGECADLDWIKDLLEKNSCTSNCDEDKGPANEIKETESNNPDSNASKNESKHDETSSKSEEIKKNDDCTSDCDSSVSECEDGSCEEKKDCEKGNCGSDNSSVKDLLKRYGIDINDCVANGNCGNGEYNFTYGNYEDIESLLKSFGINSQNTQKPSNDNKPSTDSKPSEETKPDSDTSTESKPDADENADSSVSDYEKRVVELVNIEREKYGLSPLTLNVKLSAVARAKSQDMKDKHYFSHTSPTYGSPFDMMESFGISYRTAGENIAMGQRTPEEVVKGWMNSQGHRANILNLSFKEIGVGYVAEGNYWTQMFIG